MTYVPQSAEVDQAEREGHERMSVYVSCVRELVAAGESAPAGERAFLAGLMKRGSDWLIQSAYRDGAT